MSANSVNTPVIIYVHSETCIHTSIKNNPGIKTEVHYPLNSSNSQDFKQFRRNNSFLVLYLIYIEYLNRAFSIIVINQP